MKVRLQAWHAGVYRAPGLLVSVGDEVEVDEVVGAELLRDFPGCFVEVAPAEPTKPPAEKPAKPPAEKPAKPKG